eukprot:gene14144-biopygen12032
MTRMTLTTLLAATALTGFAFSASAAQLTIGFSQIGSESGWRAAETTVSKSEAKKRNINFKIADAQQKQENQIKAIRSFVTQGVDAIFLAPHWAASVPGVAFSSPNGTEPYDMAPFGRQWFSLQDRTPARLAAGVAAASDSLESFIDSELLRLGLPVESVALMGFSQGAMTVLHAGLRRA